MTADLLARKIDSPRDAVRRVRVRCPCHIDAWVVLPDHVPCPWTRPDDDADFPGRWQAFEMAFFKSLPATKKRSAVMGRGGGTRDRATAIPGAHDPR